LAQAFSLTCQEIHQHCHKIQMLFSANAQRVEEEIVQDAKLLEGKKIPEWRRTGKALKLPKEPMERKVVRTLHSAAKAGDLDLVRSFVRDSLVNPNFRDEKGWTALLRAAKAGKADVVQFLCSAGADLDAHTKEKNTALMKATKNNHPEVLKILCDHGASLDLQNKGGATALMLAAQQRSADCVTVLLKAKADVNAQKDVGYSALMVAARYGRLATCSALLSAGAEIDMEDNQGETALAKAEKHRRSDVVEFLLAHGAMPSRGSKPVKCIERAHAVKPWKAKSHSHRSVAFH